MRPKSNPESPQPHRHRQRSWLKILWRSVQEFREDNMTDWAAALTYYTVLALFPALIALTALLGLFGQYPRTSDALLEIVAHVGPSSAVDTFRDPVEGVVRSKGGAGALVGFGLLGAIWAASGYIGAFIRAANVIYETEEGRPFWKLRPLQIVITVLMVILLAFVAMALVLTGPLADAVGDVIGLGGAAVTAWSIAKWPALVLVVVAMIMILYYAAPNVRQPGFRSLRPGALLALAVWVLASIGFALYVATFGSYNKTYGTLAGVVVFLVWLWISNNALLLGAELNAELERERELEAGEPAEEELQLPARTEP